MPRGGGNLESVYPLLPLSLVPLPKERVWTCVGECVVFRSVYRNIISWNVNFEREARKAGSPHQPAHDRPVAAKPFGHVSQIVDKSKQAAK